MTREADFDCRKLDDLNFFAGNDLYQIGLLKCLGITSVYLDNFLLIVGYFGDGWFLDDEGKGNCQFVVHPLIEVGVVAKIFAFEKLLNLNRNLQTLYASS